MELVDSKILNINRFGTEVGCQLSDAIFFVLDGSFSLKADGREEIVSKNEIAFFPKDMFFERYILSSLSFYYVKITGNDDLPKGKIPLGNPMRILSTMSLLHTCTQNGDRELSNHFLKDIFKQIEAEKRHTNSHLDRITSETVQYFKENLNKKITLSCLTAKLGISSTSLIDHFKAAVGETPLRYLTLLRIARAEEMLLTTDLTLFEIAAECGYDTPFYLSNAFKKEKGISPRAYRSLYRV